VQAPAGRRRRAQLREHGVRVDEVLEHVVAADRVPRPSAQARQALLDRADLQLVEHRRRLCRRDRVDLDARDRARAGRAQPARHAAFPAADVQHPPERARQRRHEVAAAVGVVARRLLLAGGRHGASDGGLLGVEVAHGRAHRSIDPRAAPPPAHGLGGRLD